MQWTKQSEQNVYANRWFSVNLADVELPDGRHLDHFLIRLRPVAVATVVNEANEVLLLWRHRFITDAWGWEIPAGGLDAGESPEDGARRETVEEAGWRPGELEHLASYNPMPGGVDQTFHLFLTHAAEEVGEPTDPTEAERVEWVPLAVVREAIADGRIVEGMTLTALSLALATGRLG